MNAREKANDMQVRSAIMLAQCLLDTVPNGEDHVKVCEISRFLEVAGVYTDPKEVCRVYKVLLDIDTKYEHA